MCSIWHLISMVVLMVLVSTASEEVLGVFSLTAYLKQFDWDTHIHTFAECMNGEQSTIETENLLFLGLWKMATSGLCIKILELMLNFPKMFKLIKYMRSTFMQTALENALKSEVRFMYYEQRTSTSVFYPLSFLSPVYKVLFFPKSLPIFIILAIIKRRKNKVLRYPIDMFISVNINSPIFCNFIIIKDYKINQNY